MWKTNCVLNWKKKAKERSCKRDETRRKLCVSIVSNCYVNSWFLYIKNIKTHPELEQSTIAIVPNPLTSSPVSLSTPKMSSLVKEAFPFPKQMRTFVLLLMSFFQSLTSVNSSSFNLLFFFEPTTRTKSSAPSSWIVNRLNITKMRRKL